MRRPPKAAADGAPHPFGAPGTGRLTWLGLSIALIGWAALIAVAALADGSRGPRQPLLHGDLVTMAQTLIGSGFALAAIGALQSGFGSLDRFFGAVLMRTGTRAAAPLQPVAAAAEPMPMMRARFETAAVDPPPPPTPSSVPSPARRRRPYRTLPDGSVEVETILGTRRFASMGDAREFI